MSEKRCPSCELVLPLSSFSRHLHTSDGLTYSCTSCINARRRANYAAKHAQRLATKRRWEAANRERSTAQHRQRRLIRPLDREKRILAHQRRRARIALAPVNNLTRAEWLAIKQAFGYRCAYCGKKLQRLTMDHITPLSEGGSHTLHNVVPACGSCNYSKQAGPPLSPVQPLLLVG